MPKHLYKPSRLDFTKNLVRRVEMQFQINSATEFLLKKVAKLEEQLEKAEVENDRLKAKLNKNGKKKKI